jgi:hypothetical protein
MCEFSIRIYFSCQLRSRVTGVLGEVKTSQPGLEQQLRKKAWARFGRDHPDKDLLDPLPVPLIIVGNKFDVFQNMDPEQRKMVARTLRFIAHTNGASLYVSHLRQKLVVLTHYMVFKAAISHSDCFMHDFFKPAHPQFMSMKSDVLVGRVKQILSHLAFGTPLRYVLAPNFQCTEYSQLCSD